MACVLTNPDASVVIKYHNIIAAVKRCYENVRRSFMEGQDGKENYVEEQSKRRRYRARRQRVHIINFMGIILLAFTATRS